MLCLGSSCCGDGRVQIAPERIRRLETDMQAQHAFRYAEVERRIGANGNRD
jgi:hypothetical protein